MEIHPARPTSHCCDERRWADVAESAGVVKEIPPQVGFCVFCSAWCANADRAERAARDKRHGRRCVTLGYHEQLPSACTFQHLTFTYRHRRYHVYCSLPPFLLLFLLVSGPSLPSLQMHVCRPAAEATKRWREEVTVQRLSNNYTFRMFRGCRGLNAEHSLCITLTAAMKQLPRGNLHRCLEHTC